LTDTPAAAATSRRLEAPPDRDMSWRVLRRGGVGNDPVKRFTTL
jgi:hypothetical protein